MSLFSEFKKGNSNLDYNTVSKTQIQRAKLQPNITKPQSTDVVRNSTNNIGGGEQSSNSVSGANLLKDYSSFVYNFTLAALSRDDVNKTFRSVDELKHVILTSKGKGSSVNESVDSATMPLPTSTSQPTTATPAPPAEHLTRWGTRMSSNSVTVPADHLTRWGTRMSYSTVTASQNSTSSPTEDKPDISIQESISKLEENEKLLKDYYKQSPGRFDMFIDDVVIQSWISQNEETSSSLPVDISFTVVEPYGMFGFIESLLAMSIAAGYQDHLTSTFILAVDFSGYRYDSILSDPINSIPNTTRFYPIKLIKITTSVSDQGAIYKCTAAFAPDAIAFGLSTGTLKQDIEIKGKTVREQLNDFTDKINKAVEVENNRSDRKSEALSKVNIRTVDLADKSKENLTFSNSGVKDSKIVVRASESVLCGINRIMNNSLVIIDQAKPNNDSTFIKSFLVTSSIDTKSSSGAVDPVTKLTNDTVVYSINEYTTVKSMVPNQAPINLDYNELLKYAQRRYNFMYSGDNTEIVDLKIDFDYTFIAAAPPGNGAKTDPDRTTVGRSGESNPKVNAPSQQGSVATPATRSTPVEVSPSPDSGILNSSPWSQRAYNMFRNILNNQASMFQGQMTILGDPLYLTGGSNGQQFSGLGRATPDGVAPVTAGDLLIQINFLNPIDISSFGFLDVNKAVLSPYSGIFKVIRVDHHFVSGVFTQVLQFVRINSDVINPYQKSPPVLSTEKNPLNTKVEDASPANVPAATIQKSDAQEKAAGNTPPTPLPVVKPVAASFDALIAGKPANPVSLSDVNKYFSAGSNLKSAFNNSISAEQSKLLGGISGTINSINADASKVLGDINGLSSSIKNAGNSVKVAADSVSPLKKFIG